MKYFLLVIMSIAFFSCTCDYPESQNVEFTKEEKEKLRYLKEVEWPKSYREQDTILLDRILADEYQYIESDGNYSNKKIELDWIKHNKPNYDSFYYEIKRFEFFENGTAIVSGTGHIFNDTIETIYQSSNIFIMHDGNWKAIASHVSGVK